VDTERNGLIDYGRFLAALGIVWFNAQAPGDRIAYLALPFFLLFELLGPVDVGTQPDADLLPDE